MGKKEQVPARAIFVQGSLWVWSAASRGRPPDGGLALAVFHMVPRVPAAPNANLCDTNVIQSLQIITSSLTIRLLVWYFYKIDSHGHKSLVKPSTRHDEHVLGSKAR